MTLAVAPGTATPSRRPVRRGWCATPERPFPTLGWLILEWTYAYLPSPANDKHPLVYTDEQARRVLEWFRLNPLTGAFVYNRRLHLEEAKGFGKSPFAASLDLADLAGPVCFDGWDADGQPVGVPWGTGDRPSPWIQVAAVSEAQTRNTYSAIWAMLTANDHRAARDLRIDEGRTRLYLRDIPDAILEPVTASAGSREGQRVTKATLDEPQLWTPSNGGHKLADTILGNLTKMDGRAVFTGNAYVRGEESVAERFDFEEAGVLRYARRPAEEPQQDWPREKLLAQLHEVYEGAPWAPLERIVDDATSPTANWERSKRLFWNIPSSGAANRWIPGALWDDRGGEPILDGKTPTYAVVTVAHDHRSAAIAVAQRHGSTTMLRVRTFPEGEMPEGELVPVADLEAYVRGLREHFPAYVMAVRTSLVRGGREHRVALRGPEVTYNGSFFEGSAQKLRREGLALLSQPGTQERLAPASETLKAAVLEQRLVHDGGAELAEQIADVVAVESANGWTIREAGPAARAAMVAVHRALTAPAAPSRSMHRGAPR